MASFEAMSDEPHGEEPSEDELEAMGARKASPKTLVMVAVAGALVAVLFALASYYASQRDRARESSETTEQR